MVCSMAYGFLAVMMVALVHAAPTKDEKKIELRMPGVQPQLNDTYLCFPMEMGKKPTYLTGFVPHANMSTAHHMLLYGCSEPGEKKGYWTCGEMANADTTLPPVCKSGSQIVYAWAMDAPQLHLPEGVAFKVGGDTSVKYLVLQVHYKDVSKFVPPNNEKDESGLTLITTSTPQPRRAGVYLLMSGGSLPPHSKVSMEIACKQSNDDVVIHPFAFRTHTHTHGRLVYGYRVRDGHWKEIGKMSPQKPQMFYNVTDPDMTVERGDTIAARCEMVNDEDREVQTGPTQNDEMCNFYMMYWVDGDKILSNQYCFSMGPPQENWETMGLLDNFLGAQQLLETGERLMGKMEREFLRERLQNEDLSNIIEREDFDPEDDKSLTMRRSYEEYYPY